MATLPGVVQSGPSGATGFDASDQVTSADQAAQLAAQFRFCLRYVSFGTPAQGDLDTSEATLILQAGLALMPVYPVPYSTDIWQPDGSSGTVDGGRAAANARSVGFPAGVNLWLDLESIAPDWPAQNVIDHCNNWYAAVAAAGYLPGLYVGVPCGLSSDQLYYALAFQHYWRSGSGSAPDVSVRGFQMIQTIAGATAAGIGIDTNVTQQDALGGSVQWLTTS